MPHYRQDAVTKRWVSVANHSTEMDDIISPSRLTHSHTELDLTCVFCPGNEALNPDVLVALPQEKNWRVRIVEKRLETDALIPAEDARFYHSRSDAHEHNLVALRNHAAPLALASVKDLDLLFQGLVSRAINLLANPQARYVHIWHDYTQKDSHTLIELKALPFIPEHIAQEYNAASNFYRLNNVCPYCSVIAHELKEKSRIVYQNKQFIAFVPFAATSSFQIKITPLQHCASIVDLTSSQRKDLAEIIKTVSGLVYGALNNPTYTLSFVNAPRLENVTTSFELDAFHWYMEINPIISFAGGFEKNTGIFINPLAPEQAAALLR